MTFARRVTIGVDVGGTNIDAVALVGGENAILGTFKAPTTADPSQGIVEAIDKVIKQASLHREEIASIVIGTTHFVNAVASQDATKLDPVAVIRLGAPYTEACPPFADFPLSLRALIEGPTALCKGGVQIDGRPIGQVDEAELQTVCARASMQDIRAVVITGIYSVLNGGQQEKHAGRIVKACLPRARVVCSSDVGTDGLVEREGAAILNASLLRFARATLLAFRRGIQQGLGLSHCPLFLTQNDGTLCSFDRAAQLPIRTFSSGATNSMRGASYLGAMHEKESNATVSAGKPVIVIDIGGTTTDVGVLLPSGFPRQAAAYVNVSGVRTCFSMPDVISIGLGGGSLVVTDKTSGKVAVGPQSTGYRLLKEGLVFGGATATATDVAVAAGRATGVGNAAHVQDYFDKHTLHAAQWTIKSKLEQAISLIKTWPEPATVLCVGGGAILMPLEDTFEGVETIVRPKHFDCANAVGAAVARVSVELDTIKNLLGIEFKDAVRPLQEELIKRTIEAGAAPASVKIVEVIHLPVQYVATGATKIRIRATGDLDHSRAQQENAKAIVDRQADPSRKQNDEVDGDVNADGAEDNIIRYKAPPPYPCPIKTVDQWTLAEVQDYRPTILPDKTWTLTELDLRWIAEGCGVLGVGGGGSTFHIMVICREILRKGGRIRVASLDDLPENLLVGRCCMMGSPSVSEERIQAGPEELDSITTVLRYIGIPLKEIKAMISDEIGGGNGIEPALLASSAYLDVPLVDADLMGRAYPFLFSSLPVAYDIPGQLPPVSVVDGQNNRCIITSGDTRQRPEELLRVVCDKIGSMGFYAGHPLSVEQIRAYGVLNSYSQCWRLGRAMHVGRLQNNFRALPQQIFTLQTGRVVFQGKCTEVFRKIKNAWTFGHLRIRPLDKSEMENLQDDEDADARSTSVSENQKEESVDEVFIQFQNEYLCVESTRADGSVRLHAIVPDLITILDSQSGVALGTHEVRYGHRLTVIALACDPKWTTKQGLEMGGPDVWQLGHAYKTCVEGEYRTPSSVIREYECK